MTALIIPVASTTSWISPLSTLAVKCCGALLWFRPNATNSPATTTAPAKMSHLLFIFISRPGTYVLETSFISQRLDRIEQRGFSRRVISKKNSYRYGKQRRHNHRFNRHLHRPLQRPANQVRANNSKKDPRGAAYQAEHHGFPEKLQLNRFFRGAYGDAHPNLSRSLRHRNEHD